MLVYESSQRLTAGAVSTLCNVSYGEELFDIFECIGSRTSIFHGSRNLKGSTARDLTVTLTGSLCAHLAKEDNIYELS